MSLSLARRIRDQVFPVPFILAGGLNSRNVASAIACVRPRGVDAFSGVTTAGNLDAAKVGMFVAGVRASKEVSPIGKP